jgi:hypothetical protein
MCLIRSLVKKHRAEIPIVVAIWEDGFVKQGAYDQIFWNLSLRELCRELGQPDPEIDPFHCPVFGDSREECGRRYEVSAKLGLGRPFGGILSVEMIRCWLKENPNESGWRDRWLDLMAWSCGVIDMPGAISRLLARLTERGQSVVFLLDGIEQVFQELDSSEAQRRAVRALLQDVPNWLRENGDNRVGAIIFVQRSTVTAAVRRNSLQLMALYEEYSLS